MADNGRNLCLNATEKKPENQRKKLKLIPMSVLVACTLLDIQFKLYHCRFALL